MFKQNVIHYPNLKTVIMIESFLERQSGPVSKNYIFNNLQKKIMRQTLNVTLEYLELSGKIFIGSNGVEWTFDDNKKLKIALKKVADEFI